MEPERYEFIYESTGRFILLLLPVIPVYLLLTFAAAPALETRFAEMQIFVWHSLTCLFIAGGGFILMCTLLRPLYILRGICMIYEERIEFQFKDKIITMPLAVLKEVRYHMGGVLVLTAKKKTGAKGIWIRSASYYEDKHEGIVHLYWLYNILQSRHGHYERFGHSQPKSW